jgi:hypothetical protein
VCQAKLFIKLIERKLPFYCCSLFGDMIKCAILQSYSYGILFYSDSFSLFNGVEQVGISTLFY